MHRHCPAAACAGIVAAVSTVAASGGTIDGRREGMFGGGVHESFIWIQAAGNNAANAHDIALSWDGDFLLNAPAGTYHLAANEHGPYPHNIRSASINVPVSGTLNVQLDDRLTLTTEGLTDLGACTWAAQTFVATGRDLALVEVISPSGGSVVRVTLRDGGPAGPQIGPHRTLTNGSLFPAFARWTPGEVPLIPGRLYAVRFDGQSGPWRPAVSYRPDPYPNGQAWFDGLPIPNADLRVSVQCRDNGFIDGYRVDNWWRPNTYTEYVQTFVASGAELRIAQMMLAGPGGEDLMQASVHGWAGTYPPGSQIGPTKHANMGENVFHGFVWGPGEVPLTPSAAYANKYRRADGQAFAIYGDTDRYSQGQAYFDGAPQSGIDMAGRLVFKEQDRGEIALSSLVLTPISATEIRATFQTDVTATATLVHSAGSSPFDVIAPASTSVATLHDVTLRHLTPNTTYPISVLAYNASRNVLRSPPVQVATLNTIAPLSGTVESQIGPVAGAEVIVEEVGLSTLTDPAGQFTFPAVPTGRHLLLVQAVAHASTSITVDVTPAEAGDAAITTSAYSNLLASSDASPAAGWTAFGHFNGAFNSGAFDVDARTGPKWVGYVTNGANPATGVHGGMHRTVSVEPGKTHRFGGFVQTRAFGSADDPIDGLAVARIGVDPTGGTDPDASTVLWSRFLFTSGVWREQTVDFVSPAGQATLFCQHRWEGFYPFPPWYIVGFEDLWLGTLLPTPTPIPDFDVDGDIDQVDYGFFQACLTGPGVPQLDPACAKARLDPDEDADHDDFGIFQTCAAGPAVAYDPGCVPTFQIPSSRK